MPDAGSILSRMNAMLIVRYRRPLDEVIAHQEAHRAFQRKLKEEGTLLAAGPHQPRFGGMFLVRVPDDNPQTAVDAIRDADPYYQAGVVQLPVVALERSDRTGDSLDKL